jgi:EEF1A lysine methyltransferase 2
MLGVDYSPQSISLARTLAYRYASTDPKHPSGDLPLEGLAHRHSDPATQPWWPGEGLDRVLDKGTTDAHSLSSETITSPTDTQHRVCELYPSKVLKMVKPGGFLLVTSCNWTEEEVVHWFTTSKASPESVESVGKLEVWGKVKYPKYKFGGQEGQGVASICFCRVS